MLNGNYAMQHSGAPIVDPYHIEETLDKNPNKRFIITSENWGDVITILGPANTTGKHKHRPVQNIRWDVYKLFCSDINHIQKIPEQKIPEQKISE